MKLDRRNFLKLAGTGAACMTLGQLGFDLAPVKAYAAQLKISGAKEILTVCPFCSVSCNVIGYVKDGKLVSSEGDPDYPVNEGALCAKGAAMLSMTTEHNRLQKPMYRAPYSDKWEEKSWDWILNQIAKRVKDTRDKDFILRNDSGQAVNRIESMFLLGTSHASNEECALTHQFARALGLVYMDHQARVCHSSTVSALGESFGRGAMTNHWTDIANADSILIMGSNAAEHHPISFKFVLRAKDKGATVMHVDPKFSRTSARSDFHVPLRSGTDIAFLGGMIKYIIENKRFFPEYVTEYTNASLLVDPKFGFKDGLFTGYDAMTRSYDKSTWNYQMDDNGVPRKDKSLKNPNCVFQLLKKHYDRYDIDKVSKTTGVAPKVLEKVYKTFSATGRPDKAGTVLYALGWTQHTVGVQNIRTSGIIQLLLGNIGVAGGGINALRGEPNVQGSTDHAMLYHILPGYMAMPAAPWQTLELYNKANTPVSHDPESANWWQHKPEYMTSLLKAWFGDNATAQNDFCYNLLPKIEKGHDYSYLFLFDRMYKGEIKGGFFMGLNPMNSVPNTHKIRKAMDNLDWCVCAELHNSETTENWHRPDVDPKTVKTEMFLLPSAHRMEKSGSVTNSGRWVLWHHKCVDPQFQTRPFGEMYVPLFNIIREMYRNEGGTFAAPILNQDWPEKFNPDDLCQRINGRFHKDTEVKGKMYKKGQQVPSFTALSADGATSSLNWLYCGSWTEEAGNKSLRRSPEQTPMQAKIALYPNWSWSWPVNRRILYNRASVDLNGKPYNKAKAVIEWQDGKWVGDVPDGGWPPLSSGKGKLPFIMQTHGLGHLFGPGRMDGPFPEHYEPAETPVDKNLFSKQLSSPVYKFTTSAPDVLAKPADPNYPIVLTTYSLTEHWCGGGETRNVPNLLEAEPQLYVEMSPELAKEKGIKNGDGVIIESIRGKVQAIAMVTVRMRPLMVHGRIIHEIGMPYCFGWTTPGSGDSTNRLTPSVGDPNTTIPEYKACCVNVRKADKLTELAR
ncbi:MAG: formate dehydrogenase-N subunit alpha [Pseudodesulfovibrio sp.]|uniref:formate dehydrogenase-N subunit alpha n=1 Tax=Pseudodesulfovibrio sp. TaxID=2035812 RepID=UPI003D117A8F